VPGAFGSILTAGVALTAAAVVVANPVVVPRDDVQIPVSELPTVLTGDGHPGGAVDMLDEDFIRAVGPAPTPASNPLAVLTDLVRVLVADATYLGRNAILHAFATGARVIADPALTSTSYPYVAPETGPGVAPYAPEAPFDPAALQWPAPVDLGPVVSQALSAILTDGGDVGDAHAVAAAFAAGVALSGANLPGLGDVVESVLNDVGQIVDDTASVDASLPYPGRLIGDGIRTVIAHMPAIRPVLPRLEAPAAIEPESEPVSEEPGSPPATGEANPTSSLADRRTRAPEGRLALGPGLVKAAVDTEATTATGPTLGSGGLGGKWGGGLSGKWGGGSGGGSTTGSTTGSTHAVSPSGLADALGRRAPGDSGDADGRSGIARADRTAR